MSILDARIVDRARLHGPRQATEAYLLALAVTNDGRFVTFDRSVALNSVHGASEGQLTIL